MSNHSIVDNIKKRLCEVYDTDSLALEVSELTMKSATWLDASSIFYAFKIISQLYCPQKVFKVSSIRRNILVSVY